MQVCALLTGGGYAELVAVPALQVLPVPKGLSLVEAASLPEVSCTVWSTVFMTAGLKAGETLLVRLDKPEREMDALPSVTYHGAGDGRSRRGRL